jgi:hypothetical protein
MAFVIIGRIIEIDEHLKTVPSRRSMSVCTNKDCENYNLSMFRNVCNVCGAEGKTTDITINMDVQSILDEYVCKEYHGIYIVHKGKRLFHGEYSAVELDAHKLLDLDEVRKEVGGENESLDKFKRFLDGHKIPYKEVFGAYMIEY